MSGMPEPIAKVAGRALPLFADDVDTDQIIPAEFLKITQKKGLGRYLFYRWRQGDTEAPENFVLGRPEFEGSPILVGGRNFGIGSSRENAVWALLDYGVKCVMASSFGDIFYANAYKNGLVCVRLPDGMLSEVRREALAGALDMTVDLPRGVVVYGGRSVPFDMEEHVRERLTKGLDDISLTLSKHGEAIGKYEAAMPAFLKVRPAKVL